jgi:hypothetical protein
VKKYAITDVLAGIFLLALVMILVRPNSLAPAFLKTFGTALDGMVTFAVAG